MSEIEKAKEVTVAEIIKAAAGDENAKKSGKQLGKTALTLTTLINNALLPIALINFAFERARQYFTDEFPKDLSEKAEKIPQEHLVQPKASIAGPALQGLAFSCDEPDLKELYLNLISAAMDGRVSKMAHPAFVEIIKQLTSGEAALLRHILKTGDLPIVEIRLRLVEPQGWVTIRRHVISLPDEIRTRLSKDDIQSYMDNYHRLGVISIDYNIHLVGDNVYNSLESGQEVLEANEQFKNSAGTIYCEHGKVTPTAFGRQFAAAVGIKSP